MQARLTEQDAIAAFQRGDLDRARSLAEQQLAQSPSAQLLHLMGLIECRIGRLDAGVNWLRRAVEGEPGNVGFRVMLARALIDAGRADEALEVAPPPSAGTSPAELALWHARGEAADAVGNSEIAAEAWGRLCSLGAGDWRAWSNLGNASAGLARWSNAATAFRRALELNPSEVSLRRSLATALSRAGEFQESADELGRWVEASPKDVTIRIMFARLLADLGRDEEALAQLDKAAQLAGHPAFDETSEVLIAIAGCSADASDGRTCLSCEVLRCCSNGRTGWTHWQTSWIPSKRVASSAIKWATPRLRLLCGTNVRRKPDDFSSHSLRRAIRFAGTG